jgi:hypothetical protein
VFSVCASLCTVFGYGFQKIGLRRSSVAIWLVGFMLVGLAGGISTTAYALTPMSLIAPLGGLTVVFNFFVAPCLIDGEKIHLYPDVPAALLVFAGCTVTTLSGTHNASRQFDSMDDILRLFAQPSGVGVVLGSASLAMTGLIGIEFAQRKGLWASRVYNREDNPPFGDMLLHSFVPAAFGTITNTLVKVFAEMVKLILVGMKSFEDVFVYEPSRLCIVPVFLAANVVVSIQLYYMNRGFQLYPQMIFVPVFSSLLLLGNTFGGGLFFSEQAAISHKDGTIFCVAVGLVAAGVMLFSQRQPERGIGVTESDEERAELVELKQVLQQA